MRPAPQMIPRAVARQSGKLTLAGERVSKHRLMRVQRDEDGKVTVLAEWNATARHPWRKKRLNRAAAKRARAARKITRRFS